MIYRIYKGENPEEMTITFQHTNLLKEHDTIDISFDTDVFNNNTNNIKFSTIVNSNSKSLSYTNNNISISGKMMKYTILTNEFSSKNSKFEIIIPKNNLLNNKDSTGSIYYDISLSKHKSQIKHYEIINKTDDKGTLTFHDLIVENKTGDENPEKITIKFKINSSKIGNLTDNSIKIVFGNDVFVELSSYTSYSISNTIISSITSNQIILSDTSLKKLL